MALSRQTARQSGGSGGAAHWFPYRKAVIFWSRNKDTCKWLSWRRQDMNTTRLMLVELTYLHVFIWISDTIEHHHGCNCTKEGGHILLMATEWRWSHRITVIDSWPPCLADGGHLNKSNMMIMFKLKRTQLMNRGCNNTFFRTTYWVCRNVNFADETGLTLLRGKSDQKWDFGRMNPS